MEIWSELLTKSYLFGYRKCSSSEMIVPITKKASEGEILKSKFLSIPIIFCKLVYFCPYIRKYETKTQVDQINVLVRPAGYENNLWYVISMFETSITVWLK